MPRTLRLGNRGDGFWHLQIPHAKCQMLTGGAHKYSFVPFQYIWPHEPHLQPRTIKAFQILFNHNPDIHYCNCVSHSFVSICHSCFSRSPIFLTSSPFPMTISSWDSYLVSWVLYTEMCAEKRFEFTRVTPAIAVCYSNYSQCPTGTRTRRIHRWKSFGTD